jgi:amidophosphoribosyltransferase
VYFLRESSKTDGYLVSDVRASFGKSLANKETIKFDNNTVVVGIPSSGISSAKSYAEYLNIQYKQIIIKNKEINRTFILPNDEERKRACDQKFIYNEQEINNKKIVVVDDSIVRGNVIKNIISKLWLLGAKEVHIRIPSPKVISVCNYGIDIPSTSELLASNRTIEDMCHIINATSLKFLEIEDLNSLIPKFSYKEVYGVPVEQELIDWNPYKTDVLFNKSPKNIVSILCA